MMATGFRTPVGLRIVAATPQRLDAIGAALRAIVPARRGSAQRRVRIAGRRDPSRARPRSGGAGPAPASTREAVRATADLVVTGGQIGDYLEHGRALRLRVLPSALDSTRGAADQLRDVTVRAGADGAGQPVPLGLLGRAVYTTRPGDAAQRARRAGGVPRTSISPRAPI